MFLNKRAHLYAFLCVLIGALPIHSALAQIQVNEVAVSAGIGSENYNSSSAHGLGVIWIDYDNDGFPDLFAPNGASLPSHLYRNEGDGTFSNQDVLLPGGLIGEPTGAMFADYDNDGDQDIYITVANVTPDVADGGANHLLKNLWVENGNQTISGQPLFIDVAAAAGVDNLPSSPFGALPGRASYTGAWLDYDRDSCIDLFVGNMDWDEAGTSSNANQLYKNNCDGTFTDVTTLSGVDTGDANEDRPTLAFFGGLLTPGDIDPDLYVVNVHDASPFHHDLIYENNGDGTFTEFSATMPTFGDDSGAGMGTAVGDIDLDGDWDIYITDLLEPPVEPVNEGNTLYLGQPDGTWSENAGITAGVDSGPSWGANFVDLDHDGFEDLFVGTIAPNNAVKTIFHNNGDGTFDDVTGSAGFPIGFPARGTAVADYDRDGDMDIVQINLNDRIVLFENTSPNQGNWLQIKLEATVSNRSAIGTLVEATTGSTTRMRQVNGGASAHSQDELLVHFGLAGSSTVDELKISWPSGEVQILQNVGVNQLMTVTEPGVTPGGTISVLPSSVDFGQQQVGTSSAPMQITLSNDGNDPLSVTGVSVSGADANDFSHDFGGSVMIPGGGTSTFNATFSPAAAAAPLAGDVIYRVNAGGSLISDWEEDTDANPSSYVNESATVIQSTTSAITLDATVPAGTPMELFQTIRVDGSKAAPVMEWDFPVTAGDELTVRLFFAEIARCQTGSHVFDVVIEGTEVLTAYDPFAEVGCDTGTMKEFIVTAGDSNLDIDFPLAGNNRPSLISGIEITSESGTGGSDIRTAQLDITHEGSNPTLTVSLTGEATTDGGGNVSPTAAFTFVATELDVNFTDASTDSDGSVVSWSWDFGNGATSTDQHPAVTYAAAGTYTVELTVTDDEGATATASQAVTVTTASGSGAFIESAGMVVMEAENFHTRIDRSDHSWSEDTNNAGFSGASAMFSGPDDNTTINTDVVTTSPELSYDLDISTTGDYILWVRMWSTDNSGNSVHIGVDGAIDTQSKGVQSQVTGEWIWLNLARGSNVLEQTISTAGAHTFNLWMREDGTLVDKIVLTTDAGFVPTGEGPAESPQAAGPIAANPAEAGNGRDVLALEAVVDLPEEFALKANYPNPFNPTTTIHFDVPESSSVRLEVYDMMGRRVATLVNGQMGAGRHQTSWNGRNDAGATVASGVYLYRMQAGSFESVQRMVLMK